MSHLDHDQIVLAYYGELDDVEGLAHVERCQDCQREIASLANVLDSLEPHDPAEPPAHFKEQLWWRLRPALKRRDPGRTRRWMSLAASLVLVVGVAFIVGRMTAVPLVETDEVAPPVEATTPDAETPAATDEATRSRVLNSAVHQHFERLEILLLDFSNRKVTDDGLDLDREIASMLLPANRLLRMNAEQAGSEDLAVLLGEAEMLLMDLANADTELAATSLEDLQVTSGVDELIFKLRVASTGLRADIDDEAITETTPRETTRETRSTI